MHTFTVRRRIAASTAAAVALTALTAIGAVPGAEPVAAAPLGVQRAQFTLGSSYLIVEVLDDDLVHFELAGGGTSPGTSSPLFTTPQVDKTDYAGPEVYSQTGSVIQTADLRIEVDPADLCLTATDTTRTPELVLHEACPADLDQAWKGLNITKSAMENAYGLGQQFFTGASADGDWVGRTRTPGGTYGNAMAFDAENGPVGNTQIPVLFAVGDDSANYGLFVDQLYKQEWNLTGDPWTMRTWGDQLRWYLMAGDDLPDLREDYMELTGKPPVPPKKALGLWVSEFGYDSWGEVDNTIAGLRSADFPVDGVMLDVQWFGGVTANSDSTRMGTLDWDTTNFPTPATKIAALSADGIGVIPIEESYVGKNLPEHAAMADDGYLVRSGCATCAPVYLTGNPWWGKGGMIDWTQPAAGATWHDEQRQHLIDEGVTGHWLDLGEPEMYDADDWTAGVLPGKHAHADYHNAYNLLWAQSIADGYERNEEEARTFLLSRAAAGGIQRFGTAMWSADIGSTIKALASQQNTQMHMSMSGIDYYGSDVGGFRREMLDVDADELYTQWFADSAWFDTPLRPHTENLCNCLETSPDAIGDEASNRANLVRRYELAPYTYSLAHRANLYGEPLAPPLVYYYQNDDNVREMGHQKMLGRDLMVAIAASEGERERDVYLPAGDWVDVHSNERISSNGEWIEDVPLWRNGVFTLPAYARSGAIVPQAFVDAETKDITGKRSDTSVHDEQITTVYADGSSSSFTLYEDDGASTAYEDGAVRTTAISQSLSGGVATVTVGGASGTYSGAPSSRPTVVKLVTDGTQASAVTLGGSALTEYTSKAAFDAASSGWYNAGGSLVMAKAASSAVTSAKTFSFTLGEEAVWATFACENATTTLGQSVYVVGNIPQLGNWSPASAVKLEPSGYPTWTGVVQGLPPSSAIEWKCIKRQEAGSPNTADAWEPGGNNVLNTPPDGSAGITTGAF
ncbi:TIM-barrel domain-containing protein [Microbacterium sp. Mcb102]|uniref:TIM-barrel domain-containing protein n=1 Tax=Microbacterium sp. Mcb102 TaxID=2926012 RepID=UPI0021C63E94|nr:TIM-barrel domain-containing protein [Microbacterium sp. Mcb102]